MATRKTSTSAKTTGKIQTPGGERTAAEMQQMLETSNRIKETFDAINTQLKLTNLTKNATRTFQTFNKDTLRNYLRNPKSNETNIRNLSLYLYRYSFAYRQLVWYCATMYDLNAISVVPIYDITKNINEKKIKKNWYQTASYLQMIALDQAMLPMLITAWREDTAYGYIYDDGNTFFIHILPGQYCKVSSIEGGTLRYAFDFSYFRSHEDDLEYWDSEFKTKYNAYIRDNTLQWQELEFDREICLKVNLDDPTLNYPPFTPLFTQIINLCDLDSIMAVKNELSIYKLLVGRLETISGTKQPDDFEVDIKTALKYWQKFEANLPPEVASAISPIPIEPIEFKPTDSSDTDMLSNSTKNLVKSASAANILYSDGDGTTITKLKAICDENMILSALLPQIQTWLNIYLTYKVGKDHAHVKFLKIGPYTREERKSEYLADAQYSIPAKLAVTSLDGFTPLEAYTVATFENSILQLSETWEPLQSTHTQSGNVVGDANNTPDSKGAPTKPTDELTDEGEESRENAK